MLLRRLLLTVALSLTVSASTRSSRVRAQPAPGTATTSQIFSVALRLQPPATAAEGRFPSGCTGDDRDAFEGIKFQFILSPSASPSLRVLPAELHDPTDAEGGSATLTPGDSDLRFDSISLKLGSRTLKLGQGRLHVNAQSADAARLEITQLHVSLFRLEGDIGRTCENDATGSGALDQSPPVPLLAVPSCVDSASAPCEMLADGTLVVAFSKTVQLGDSGPRVSAVDQDGNALTMLPAPAPTPPATGYLLPFRAAWPLGRRITVRVAAGVRDLADNVSTEPVERSFFIIPDPGALDATGNYGFETGDLGGYTVRSLRGVTSFGYPSGFGVAPSPEPQTLTDLHGIAPAEGRFMLSAGSPTGCGDSGFALTTRLGIPDDATSLVLDYNAVLRGGGLGTSTPLLSATVLGGDRIETAEERWPPREALSAADSEVMQSGWHQVRIPVQRLAGSEALLTLRLRTSILLVPLCFSGIVLLDNLRFE